MKKSVTVLLLCTGILAVCLAGCGGKNDQKKGEPEIQAQTTGGETADKTQPADDGETADETQPADAAQTSGEADGQADGDEVNAYGLTASQQEALLASVKASVTENYLKPYNIAPADFKILPYDANDLNNYTASGEYTGEDPYQCALMWHTIDQTIYNSNSGLGLYLPTAMDMGNAEIILDMLHDKNVTVGFENSLEAENEKIKEESGFGYYTFDDTASEQYVLKNAVYAGIADFLNSLEEKECIDVIRRLYEIADEAREDVTVGAEGTALQTVGSTAMFDKVISENIQFE